MQRCRNEFEMIYGPDKGRRIFDTVMPNILKDFYQELAKAGHHVRITETYTLDDKRAVIEITGTSSPLLKNPGQAIESVRINRKTI